MSGGKAKIVTTPLKYSGTGIHTLKYFESRRRDESDAEIAENSHLWMGTIQILPFMKKPGIFEYNYPQKAVKHLKMKIF